MLKNKLMRVLPLLALAAFVLAPMGSLQAASLSGDSTITLSSPMLQGTEPVTQYAASGSLISTLDPQRAEDEISISPVENLFLGLTDNDPKTTSIRPEMATKWERSKDGTVWTFTLRNDVPWVRWDPKAKTLTEIRKVTAKDFEYGIKRACDPRLGAYYTSVAAAMIKGCDVVSKLKNEEVKDNSFDQVAVKALDDVTLQITTQGPLSYFLSASGMWVFRATPKEAIDEFGDKWTEPGNIITNGNYLLDTWDKNVNRIFVKNTKIPKVNDDYGGNLERISVIIVKDAGTQYSLYQNNELDTGPAPRAELQNIRKDPELSKQIIQTSSLSVFYFGFAYDKPPFDKVGARRAFSAALDRKTFVQEVEQGLGIPMAHFMPPGIRGAVPVNEIGVGNADNLGFDADYAKKQLAAAGYADCKNFPEITILVYEGATDWAEYLQNSVKNNLGCDATRINIEQRVSVLHKSIKPDVPTQQRPNMWTLGWGPDYPDAHNWVHDVLSCNAENDFKRACNDKIDKVIDDLAKEVDQKKRDDGYRQVEDLFFGADGDFPIAPLFLAVSFGLVKPWYTGFFNTDALFGGPHWESRKIDQAKQLAARGGANKPLVTPTAKP
jgi:oligopeptide transport system substrate-binding protein